MTVNCEESLTSHNEGVKGSQVLAYHLDSQPIKRISNKLNSGKLLESLMQTVS